MQGCRDAEMQGCRDAGMRCGMRDADAGCGMQGCGMQGCWDAGKRAEGIGT